MTQLQLVTGADGYCERCGIVLRLDKERAQQDRDAKMIRMSLVPKGLCATCAFREWLAAQGDNDGIGPWTPKMFHNPGVQKIVGDLLRASGSICTIAEIDWKRLETEWDLPFPKAMKKKKSRRGV